MNTVMVSSAKSLSCNNSHTSGKAHHKANYEHHEDKTTAHCRQSVNTKETADKNGINKTVQLLNNITCNQRHGKISFAGSPSVMLFALLFIFASAIYETSYLNKYKHKTKRTITYKVKVPVITNISTIILQQFTKMQEKFFKIIK